MECPDCGGECYDNRRKKADGTYKPTAPDFACKDKEGCGWKKFPPKNKGGGGGNGGGSAAPRQNTKPLGPLYHQSLLFAKASLANAFGEEVPVTDVIAAAATVFIQAANTGRPVRNKKAEPQQQRRRPEPEPEPEQDDRDFDDYPSQLNDGPDDLPF